MSIPSMIDQVPPPNLAPKRIPTEQKLHDSPKRAQERARELQGSRREFKSDSKRPPREPKRAEESPELRCSNDVEPAWF